MLTRRRCSRFVLLAIRHSSAVFRHDLWMQKFLHGNSLKLSLYPEGFMMFHCSQTCFPAMKAISEFRAVLQQPNGLKWVTVDCNQCHLWAIISGKSNAQIRIAVLNWRDRRWSIFLSTESRLACYPGGRIRTTESVVFMAGVGRSVGWIPVSSQDFLLDRQPKGKNARGNNLAAMLP